MKLNLAIKEIRSRPASAALTIDPTKCFDDLVYSSAPWKIYRQDAGMGEHDYAVFLNDIFFCRTEHSQAAHEIIRAVRFAANMKNAAAHDATIRNRTLDDVRNKLKEMTRMNDDGVRIVYVLHFEEEIESLRTEAAGDP